MNDNELSGPSHPVAVEASPVKLQFIVGSEGNPNYLVVARKGNVVLGIRPILAMISPLRCFVGMRVRSVSSIKPDDVVEAEQDGEGVIKFPSQLALDDAWPAIKFDKVDGKRASTMVGLTINRTLMQPDELQAAITQNRVEGPLVEALGAMVAAEAFILDKAIVTDWVGARLVELVVEAKHKMPLCHAELEVGGVAPIAAHEQQAKADIASYMLGKHKPKAKPKFGVVEGGGEEEPQTLPQDAPGDAQEGIKLSTPPSIQE